MENNENQSFTEKSDEIKSQQDISDFSDISEEKMFEEVEFKIAEPKITQGSKSGLGKSFLYAKKEPRTQPIKKKIEKKEKPKERKQRRGQNIVQEQPIVPMIQQNQQHQQENLLHQQPQLVSQQQFVGFDPFDQELSQRAQNNTTPIERNFDFLFSVLPQNIQNIIKTIVLRNVTNVKFIRKERYCGFQCFQKENGPRFTEYVWRSYHQYDRLTCQFKVLQKYEATGRDLSREQSDTLRLYIDQL